MPTCLSVGQPVYLHACLPACLSSYLSVCLPVSLPLIVYSSIGINATDTDTHTDKHTDRQTVHVKDPCQEGDGEMGVHTHSATCFSPLKWKAHFLFITEARVNSTLDTHARTPPHTHARTRTHTAVLYLPYLSQSRMARNEENNYITLPQVSAMTQHRDTHTHTRTHSQHTIRNVTNGKHACEMQTGRTHSHESTRKHVGANAHTPSLPLSFAYHLIDTTHIPSNTENTYAHTHTHTHTHTPCPQDCFMITLQ